MLRTANHKEVFDHFKPFEILKPKVERLLHLNRSRIQPGPDRSTMASENITQMVLDAGDKSDKFRYIDNATPKASPFLHRKKPQGVREVIKMYSLYQHHEPSSSLSRLVYDGDTRRVRACLDVIKDDELNALDRNEFSALHYAAQLNRVEILNMLVNAGASVDVQGESAMTPLHVACRHAADMITKNFV